MVSQVDMGKRYKQLKLEDRDRINENTNGLIRWNLTKGTDFSKITDEELTRIESFINQRTRKCLGYKTPLEVASSHGVALHG